MGAMQHVATRARRDQGSLGRGVPRPRLPPSNEGASLPRLSPHRASGMCRVWLGASLGQTVPSQVSNERTSTAPKVRKRRARTKTGLRDFRFHRLDAAAVGNTVHWSRGARFVLPSRNECDGALGRSHPQRYAANRRTVPAASRASTHGGTASVSSKEPSAKCGALPAAGSFACGQCRQPSKPKSARRSAGKSGNPLLDLAVVAALVTCYSRRDPEVDIASAPRAPGVAFRSCADAFAAGHTLSSARLCGTHRILTARPVYACVVAPRPDP